MNTSRCIEQNILPDAKQKILTWDHLPMKQKAGVVERGTSGASLPYHTVLLPLVHDEGLGSAPSPSLHGFGSLGFPLPLQMHPQTLKSSGAVEQICLSEMET